MSLNIWNGFNPHFRSIDTPALPESLQSPLQQKIDSCAPEEATQSQLLQKSNNVDAVVRKSCSTVFLSPRSNNLYIVMCFTKWCTLPQQLSLCRIPVYLWHDNNNAQKAVWNIIIILAPVPTLQHVTGTDFRQNKKSWRWRGNTLNKFSLYCSRFSKRISTLSHSVPSYTHPSPLVAPVLPVRLVSTCF